MKTVKVYIETTITGPSKPKYGKYAAALAFTRKNGKTEDRFLQGSEQETTYNRSVLLAMVQADNPEKWRRAEWRKSDGKDIQNKELWQLFLEESEEHEIEIVYENNSEYKRALEAYLQGEEV